MTKIAIIGGTGALGFGLGLRWANAGLEVIVGSRREDAAQAAAAEIAEAVRSHSGVEANATGLANPAAAGTADIVVVAVPFSQQSEVIASILPEIEGKLLVDTTVPLVPPRVGTVQLPPEGCSALALRALVGEKARIVSAFQNVAARKLRSLQPLDCDVLVASDDKSDREVVIGLAQAAGLRAFNAGPLANAVVAEALTSVLITVNRQYKCEAGIRLVGIEA